jgi:8-oxo-dGTP diphosphatase
MINYVCGFYFDHLFAQVVLIWKNKPKWQAGKLNGVGGKIEEGETPRIAMRREFKEETGIDHEKWNDLIVLTGENWRVYFFYAEGNANEFEYAETKESEEIAKIEVDRLDDYPHISNLRWLIPMALYKIKFPEESLSFYKPHLLTPPQGNAALHTMLHDPKDTQEQTQEAAGAEQEAANNEEATQAEGEGQ